MGNYVQTLSSTCNQQKLGVVPPPLLTDSFVCART